MKYIGVRRHKKSCRTAHGMSGAMFQGVSLGAGASEVIITQQLT